MEINKSAKPRKASNPPQVGGKLFCILLTACITFAATLMLVYFCNNGFVFISEARYGDAREYLVLGEMITSIQDNHYGKTPTVDELVDTSARAMVDALDDDYAQYFTNEEFLEYYKSMSGSYSGLGILIGIPDEVGALISAVYEDSPAQKAGLLAGDIVTHIDGESIAGYDRDSFNALLSGEDGKQVKLTILRGTQSQDITVTYGTVTMTYVHSKMIGTTGYILLDMFSDSATAEFRDALSELKDKGMTSLVIDLRDNPGGSLSTVLDIADMLLDGGKIVSVGNSIDDPALEEYTAGEGGIGVPIAVLVNSNSASSSEILASAIQDNDAGVIVGKTTFGKGIVQTTLPLSSSGAWLKLTTDAYFTPNGICIHGIGITPDIDVDLPAEYTNIPYTDIPDGCDTQLGAALNHLGNTSYTANPS